MPRSSSGRPVTVSGEGEQQPPECQRDRVIVSGRGRWFRRGTERSEPVVRVIGAYLHGQLTADPVRPAYPADDQLHA
jgi:hypothetical protein